MSATGELATASRGAEHLDRRKLIFAIVSMLVLILPLVRLVPDHHGTW